MTHEIDFPQRWELRGCSNDSDSSSHTSGSSSSSDPVFKKLKLVTSLVPVENVESAAATIYQQSNTEGEPKTVAVKKAQTGESKNFNVVQDSSKKPNMVMNKSKKPNHVLSNSTTSNFLPENSKKRKLVQHKARDSSKEICRTWKTTAFFDTTMLDDLKLFGKTLLEDLKLAKENLLLHMKEEIDKLMSGISGNQLTGRQYKHCEKDMPVQNQNFRKNIQDQYQNDIAKNVQVQERNRFKSGKKEQRSSQADKNIKVQPAKFKHSSKSHYCCGETSNAGKAKKVAFDSFSPVIGTPPMKERRGKRSKLSVGPNIQPDSFGQGNEVQLAKTINLGTELLKSNSIISERSVDEKNTTEGIDIPPHLEKNLDNIKDIGKSMPNEENVGRCSLSVASDILPNPAYLNGLLQYQTNLESHMKLTNYTGGSLEKFVGYEPIYGQFSGGRQSNLQDAIERFGMNYLSNITNQSGPSVYLTLPSFQTAIELGNQRLNSSYNYMRPSALGNASVVNPESTDLMVNTNVFNRAFQVMGSEEDSGNFQRSDFINTNHPNHETAPTAVNGTGLPFPSLEGTENSHTRKDHSQASMDSSYQGTDNANSPRINKGATVVSGHHMGNNFNKSFHSRNF